MLQRRRLESQQSQVDQGDNEQQKLPKYFSLQDLYDIDYKLIANKVFKMFEINHEDQESQESDIEEENIGDLPRV